MERRWVAVRLVKRGPSPWSYVEPFLSRKTRRVTKRYTERQPVEPGDGAGVGTRYSGAAAAAAWYGSRHGARGERRRDDSIAAHPDGARGRSAATCPACQGVGRRPARSRG